MFLLGSIDVGIVLVVVVVVVVVVVCVNGEVILLMWVWRNGVV